jgi:hypothetical protein
VVQSPQLPQQLQQRQVLRLQHQQRLLLQLQRQFLEEDPALP